jgi:hypothetical protein
MGEIERLSLRHPFYHIEEHYVSEIPLTAQKGQRTADLTRA